MKIINEVAQGFEGNIEVSKKLIESAKKSKADYVKFHLIIADEIATEDYKYYKKIEKFEFKFDDWVKVRNLCKKKKLKLCLDIFGSKSLEIAKKLKVDAIKIHPTDINNFEFIRQISKSNLNKIFLGIGGADLKNIKKSCRLLSNKKVTLLIGHQSYPTPPEDLLLGRIFFLKKKLKNEKLLFGYADHSLNFEMSLLTSSVAYMLGYDFIEKHLTLNQKRKLEDYESAFDYKQMSLFTEYLKKIKKISCNINKSYKINKSEIDYYNSIKRTMVAIENIPKYSKIKINENIRFLRTSKIGGLEQKEFYKYKNKILNKNKNKKQIIFKKDLL